MLNKRESGSVDFDFEKLLQENKTEGFNLDIIVAKWHTEKITVWREPFAKNIKSVYEEDLDAYNKLVDLAIKFKVKFYIEDLEEIGTLSEGWDGYFEFTSDYDTVTSKVGSVSLKDKIIRIDSLLNKEKPIELKIDKLEEIPNLTNFLIKLRDSGLKNIKIPEIVRLSDLNEIDAIEIVKIMKSRFPGFELSINPLGIKSQALSPREIVEIMLLCTKNDIFARVEGNQNILADVNIDLYKNHLYKDGINETISKYMEEFDGDFVYTPDMLEFFRVKLKHHPELNAYILEATDSDLNSIKEIDMETEQYKHRNLHVMTDTTFYIPKDVVSGFFIYLIPTFFVLGDLEEGTVDKYKGFDWNAYI